MVTTSSRLINFHGRFQTYVFDTNVGDIAPLSTYFNPTKWSSNDLNHKFGRIVRGDQIAFGPGVGPAAASVTVSHVHTTHGGKSVNKAKSLIPRLMIIQDPHQPETLEEPFQRA